MLNFRNKNFLYCLLIALITLILRIPKEALPGFDAFKLIWESQQILEGNFQAWLVHPLSIFGAYPYSGYPIGTVLCLSFFMFIANSNIIASVYMFTSFFTVLSIIAFYAFSLELFNNRVYALIATLFYETAAIYSEFSLNASPRLTFMVFFPLILLTSLKFLKTRKIKYLVFNVASIAISMLFHRMGMILFLFSLFSVLILASEKLLRFLLSKHHLVSCINFIKKNYYLVLGLFNFLVLCFTLILFHNQRWWVNKNPSFITTNVHIIDTGINTIIDYTLALGPIILLSVISPFILRFSNENSFQKRSMKLLLFNMSIFLPMVGYVAYTRFFIIPSFALFSTIGFVILYNMKKSTLFLSLCCLIPVLFVGSYLIFWRSVPIYPIIALILFILILIAILVSSIHTFYKPIKFSQIDLKKIVIFIFVISILFSNSFIMDSKTIYSDHSTNDGKRIYFDEEKEIVSFLENTEKGMITAYYTVLEVRIASFTHNLFLNSHISLLESGLVTFNDIRETSVLKPIYNWYEVFIYSNSLTTPSQYRRKLFLSSNFTDASEIVNLLNIKYIILRKNYNFFDYSGNFQYSSFIVFNNYSIIFETENYAVHISST